MKMEEIYNIKGMHCGSCVAKVKEIIANDEAVDEVNVTLDPPKAIVSTHKHIELNRLNKLLKDIGTYELSPSLIEEVEEVAFPVNDNPKPFEIKKYYPLILIFVFICGTVLINQATNESFNWLEAMRFFMAGFFIVFSFFKLLNVKAFAIAYQGYDIVAKKWFGYGLIYPFIELSLGIAYFIDFNPLITNAATFIFMSIGTIGVIQSIVNKNSIQCACLGTVFDLPMSKVTIFENLLMIIMALVMLIRII